MGHVEYFLQYRHQPYIYREGANPGELIFYMQIWKIRTWYNCTNKRIILITIELNM